MRNWLRRVRGAMGMGVIWAVGWVLAGLLIGIASKILPGRVFDWFFNTFDAPLPALAIPGFICGVLFSLVLSIAARRRTFQELSLKRFVAWGALGGVLLTALPFGLAAVGLATLNVSPWTLAAAIGGPFIAFGAASAAVSLKLARRAELKELGSPSQGTLPHDV